VLRLASQVFGGDVMMGAPSEVDEQQLKELWIKINE